jgi:hypothetical protein
MSKCWVALGAVLFLAVPVWAEPSGMPLAHRIDFASGSPIVGDSQSMLTVPADSEAHIKLLSGMHTRVSAVDDPVTALLVTPVMVDGRVALPAGSLLDGRVTSVHSAKRFHGSGELAFRFELITLPDGESQPVNAVLSGLDQPLRHIRLDSEGHLKGTHGFGWKTVAGLGSWGTFGALKLATAGLGLASPILPAVGTGLIGYELLGRGSDVHVPPDTRCRIRLNTPVTVRVAW